MRGGEVKKRRLMPNQKRRFDVEFASEATCGRDAWLVKRRTLNH